MKDLLNNFSIEQIILFIVLIAAAIKGVISWIDWAKERGDKIFHKKNEKLTLQKSVENLTKAQEAMKCDIDQCQLQLKNTINEIKAAIDLLTESDRDDIKAYITREHHYFCYVLGYIDDYNLDCLERRFRHYEDEGGNSFVSDLMKDIRALPKKAINMESYSHVTNIER